MLAARQTFKRCRRSSLLARLGNGSEARDPPPASPAAADLARQAGARERRFKEDERKRRVSRLCFEGSAKGLKLGL